jgi:CheY-like chemotaxis protein
LKLTELLEEAGYQAVACSDGRAAVRRVEELMPNLVLLDLEMPGLSGVEACRTIKQNRALAHIPVLIFTAHDDPKHLVASFDAGCAGYLVKGTADAVLLEKIARHVSVQKIVLRRAE